MTSASDYSWVPSLARRYELATHVPDNADTLVLQQLPSLQFATTVLEKAQMDSQGPTRARHIVVMGPTQSGKSTLVNILLDTRAASVSALAGFTAHSQGYASQIDERDVIFIDKLMAPMQRIAGDCLDTANLNCYVLETVSTGTAALLNDAVVWDTPDFDSISADTYSLAVIRAAAVADVILMTISKDKYGDKRVWDMLELFEAMGKPLLICINKVNEADRSVIINAFTTRFESVFGKPPPQIVILPFIEHDETQLTLPLDSDTRQLLQSAIQRIRDKADLADMFANCERFISNFEAQWLEPLVAEMNAKEHWHKLTEDAINAADDYYLTHYLNSPDKYETFNRALAELLTLLEIPGVAATLEQARKAITWPVRQLLGIGRNAFGKQSEPVRDARGQVMDHEVLVLQHILDSALIDLQRELLEAPDNIWWQALNTGLRAQLPSIRDSFNEASELARQEFEPEIEKAAAKLYEQLKHQPTLLNTLRAARASADAAGIALAVKSGGLAPTDLILAPAMLSVTTLLTESALGRYLDSVKNELMQRQREHIRAQVLEGALQLRLLGLIERMDRPELLTGELEPALMERLEAYRSSSS